MCNSSFSQPLTDDKPTLPPPVATGLPDRHKLRRAIHQAMKFYGGGRIKRELLRQKTLDILNPPPGLPAELVMMRIDSYLDTSEKMGKASVFKHSKGKIKYRRTK